jgi:tetratricopeptide (TPR) repeat protein
LQPDYALGWSGLSAAYATGALNGAERPSNVLPLAEAAAMKALELDDSLAEAHDAMAEVYLYKWNWNQALKESTRSIELDPGNAEAYYFRSLIFMTMNRMDDALESVKKSTEIDPFTRPAGVAAMLIFMRNYEAAISAANTVLETVPNDSGLHQMLAEAYQCKGMEKEAIRETEKAMVIEGDPAGASALRRTFERGGYRAIYQSQLNDLKKKAASEYVAPMSFAEAYSNLRLKEETLHFLEEAYDERAPSLVWIQTWPELDFLHGDERYRSIIRRVGLPPAY